MNTIYRGKKWANTSCGAHGLGHLHYHHPLCHAPRSICSFISLNAKTTQSNPTFFPSKLHLLSSTNPKENGSVCRGTKASSLGKFHQWLSVGWVSCFGQSAKVRVVDWILPISYLRQLTCIREPTAPYSHTPAHMHSCVKKICRQRMWRKRKIL